jgi:hypothetical protein
MTSVVHTVRMPVGSRPAVKVGARVQPEDVLATRRPPTDGVTLQVAAPLRRPASTASECLVVRPGAMLKRGEVLARDGAGREVVVPDACLFLGYDPDNGTVLLSPLGQEEPILGHVQGKVARLTPSAIDVRVAGAVLVGVAGSGAAVHGRLRVSVDDGADELRAGAIDSDATGRIVVGGSRASAETLTRARAMGVAGVVLGGVLDKDLRDFEATQQRRREVGGGGGDFSVVLLEGYGKIGMDPGAFGWLRRHDGKMVSLFGEAARLYVYDADEPPTRRLLARPGDRVVGTRRPYAGVGGRLVRILPGQHVVSSGVSTRAGLVRFEDGRTGIVPLANLEATEVMAGG